MTMNMTTRKGFLASAAALVGASGIGANATGGTRSCASVPVFKDLQTVKMLSGGGKVYAISTRINSISLSTVFVSPEGKILVVDGGNLERGGKDGQFHGEFRRSLGGHVDYWFITHAHGDHYGALVTMSERPDFYGVTIGELIYNFPERKWLLAREPGSTPYLNNFCDNVLGKCLKDVKRGDCSPGRVVNFGSWSFEILNEPFRCDGNTINNASVMISVKAGGKTWLETGDLGVEGGHDATGRTAWTRPSMRRSRRRRRSGRRRAGCGTTTTAAESAPARGARTTRNAGCRNLASRRTTSCSRITCSRHKPNFATTRRLDCRPISQPSG